MRYLYLFLFLLIAHTPLLRAQQADGSFTGQLRTSHGTPYPGATLTLYQLPDSLLTKIEVSDSTGSFHFSSITEGLYLLRISAMGLAPHESAPIPSDGRSLHDIGTIMLDEASLELEAAHVSAAVPLVTTLPDRSIVSVGQLLSAQGSTALDILKQSPGVAALSDGQLTIRGRPNVLVLIDGRRIPLEGKELVEYLQGLAAEQLHEVEVITRPSARYEAQGTAGIINLKTKRGLSNGVNGSVSVSGRQGRTFSSVNNFDMSWRRDNLQVLLNYGYVHDNPVVLLTHHNTMRDASGQTESIIDKEFLSEAVTNTHTIRTGLDYSIGKTDVGFNYQANLKLYPKQHARSHSDVRYVQQQATATHDALRERELRNPIHSASVYLTQQLAKPGANIDFVADYLAYDRPLRYFLNNTYTAAGQPDEVTRIRQDIPSDIDIFGAKADLTYPLSDNTLLEVGVKMSRMGMDNNANFELYDIQTGDYVKDAERSTHYLFNEQIHAAYANVQQQLGTRWELQAGLRVEDTRSDGEETDKNQHFDRRYTQLFPSASLTFHASEQHSFTASAARRVNRPNYEHLIPFASYSDLLFYQRGNPRLAPEVDFKADLSHTLAGKLTTTASYSRLSDAFTWTLQRDGESQALIHGFGNIKRMETFTLTADYMDQLAPWHVMMINVTGGYEHYEGMLQGEYLDRGLTSVYGQLLNQFRVSNGWAFEISGLITSKYQDSPFALADPMGQLNFTIVKQVMQGKGSVRAFGVDIFDTYRYNTFSSLGFVDSRANQRMYMRHFGLSFSYRFGTGQRQQKAKPASSTEDEAGRL